MKRTGKKQMEQLSDTACLEVLSDVASQWGIEGWSDTVHCKKAEAVTIARELHKDLQRLIGIDDELEDNEEPVTFTEVELDVLRWAAQGKGAAVTAQIMSIKERTVRRTRESIGKKLNSNSVTLSIAKAQKLGLL
jgi:DNA-binding CsgD family transcriptional regulator